MPPRLLPLIVLFLSGCGALGDALGTGIAAAGDATKYVVGKLQEGDDAGSPPAGTGTPAAAPASAEPVGGPTVTSAPAGRVEVQPLD